MANLNDNRGVIDLVVVGLTTAELALPPAFDYTRNPERFEFFDTIDVTKRYFIGPSGTYQLAASVPIIIVGVPGSGNVLTAVLSQGWSVSGWQWTRDGVGINGATSASYLQVAADVGHIVTALPTSLIFTPTGVLVGSGGVGTVWNDALIWNDSLTWQD